MRSIIFNSAWYDIIAGNINIKTGGVKCLLVDSGYIPNKRNHSRRSHVTNEVSGSGYTAGGMPVTSSALIHQEIDRIYLVLGSALWPRSTITADGAVYYNRRGGAASDDELIAYLAFSEEAISINDDFLLSESGLWVDNSNNLIV